MNNTLYCSTKAFIEKDGKFLVVKEQMPAFFYWDLPGGRMEHGETPHEALTRELKEETTIDADIHEIVGHWWFFRHDGAQVVCFAFRCTPHHTDIDLTKNPANEDLQEYRWVTRDEFLSDEYPVAHESIKQMVAGLS